MFAKLENLLPAGVLAKIHELMPLASFDDGSVTAGNLAASTKKNRQMRTNDDPARKIMQLVQQALGRDERFVTLTVPRRMHLAFNRYDVGMEYGPHHDAGVVGYGVEGAVRSDISMTVFLNEPQEYDGGTLHIITPYGEQQVKLPAGSAVIYPGNLTHWVTPITRGTRLAAFGWIQSMIRNPEQRRIVADLNRLRRRLAESDLDRETQQLAANAYQDMMRQWAET